VWDIRLRTNRKPYQLFLMYQAVQGGRITRKQLSQTLDEMLFSNLNVNMGALSWPFVFLAAHPSVQELLRREIRLHRNNDIFASTVEDSYVLSLGHLCDQSLSKPPACARLWHFQFLNHVRLEGLSADIWYLQVQTLWLIHTL
jgi:hypothetical protein